MDDMASWIDSDLVRGCELPARTPSAFLRESTSGSVRITDSSSCFSAGSATAF